MKNRLDTCFERLKSERRKALSLFVTAGIPRIEDTAAVVVALAKNGADLIELGIPFSDPVADGPTIQASSDIARANGVTLETTLAIAREIRSQSDVPLILMGYANPVYRFGFSKFFEHCSAAGVDGAIIADLPMEESKEYRQLTAAHNIAGVFLAAPTSSDRRLSDLDEITRGFLYCVSITGVTGARKGIAPEASAFLERVRRNVRRHPFLAGFGISTPSDAVEISRHCDGVVIGSALVKILLECQDGAGVESAARFTRQIRQALDSTLQ